jgi:hypothetical protein
VLLLPATPCCCRCCWASMLHPGVGEPAASGTAPFGAYLLCCCCC